MIRECTPTEIRRSKALVLMNAPGVGKTFATMTFRACSKKMSPRPPYECLTIYLGLSQGWDLGQYERDHIIRKGFSAVECVFLQRLLVALDVTLTSCQGDLSRLNEDGHDGQKIPLPRISFYPCFFSEVDMCSVKDAIFARLHSLTELCPKRKSGYRLVVLVALDEAQFLDEWILIPPDAKGGGGARYVLRALRQLQVLAYKATDQQCLLLPIATGIRPEVSLLSEKEGQNIYVGRSEDDASHVSFADFRTIVHDHVKSLRPRSAMSVGKVVSLLSAAYYPCVRSALEWQDGNSTVRPIGGMLCITHDVAVKILVADFTRSSLAAGSVTRESASRLSGLATVALDSIPHDIPVSRIDCGMAQPLVHFHAFRLLWNVIKQERSLPRLPLGRFYIGAVKDNCVAFEECMFHVFGLFMSIFCHPCKPTKPFRERSFTESSMSGCQVVRGCCSIDATTTSRTRSPTTCRLREHTSHEEACDGPIFEDILCDIEHLKSGCALWIRCGSEVVS